uniref:RNA polymerase II subunit B1 CTD phosphatase RPAP2 homolog n=1 Tax=Esox lucius TaxID=8010 RepID=A0A3P8YSY9_ESOLU
MESRKRVARSSKASKKDGKSVKAQTAAELARRTEATRVTFRERVQLEKRAVQVVERLLDNNVNEDLLVECARLITPTHYKDVVEERSIVKLCGYPICSNRLGKVPTQQFKISTKTNKVYDITERKCFCSNYCYKASKSFELQIPKSPLWLREHDSIPEIKLMKHGDGGSSGEALTLAERRLREEDVENPLPLGPVASEDPSGARPSPIATRSDDSETEQDFVSSMVSQRQRPRVHWGDIDKVDAGEPGEGEEMERRPARRGTTEEDREGDDTAETQTEGSDHVREKGSPEGQSVEEVVELLNHVTVQDRDSAAAQSGVPDHGPTPSPQGDSGPPAQPGLSITQVGMSRRGARGLRGLLTGLEAPRKPVSVRLKRLEDLRRTFKEWRTDETLEFLYGPDHFSKVPMETRNKMEEHVELDEDDLEDIVAGGDTFPGCPGRPSATAPDYETLCRETEELGLRVREFYKGTFILPEEAQQLEEKQARDLEDQDVKVPSFPLIDSRAQRLIQKRIAVEKISRRLTNTNIIHKAPEWTLITVVLLHVLSELSPVVRQALESPASVEYLSALMQELQLQDLDFQSLVRLFKTPDH